VVSLQSILLAAVLVAWLVATALSQFDGRVGRGLRRFDHFGLLPRWTFFAPRPGRSDYHLMMQLFRGKEAGAWREEPLADRRTLLGAVWNPEKRHRKALADFVRGLLRASSSFDREQRWQVQYTIPYLALLSYLSARGAAEDASHVRFMILESEGFFYEREPRPVFMSARHAVA